MNMIYNSPNYCVVEFAAPDESDTRSSAEAQVQAAFNGGYEIVDKMGRREIFLDGLLAESFRERVNALIENEPTMEDIDDFLGGFTALMQQPVTLH
ncbi:MAG TPA: DUF3567 domain-containing protein [Burkholderiaceae bacterium]|nr:DUF3567 domain-containing protein [Burkholderiaceae bacterium]